MRRDGELMPQSARIRLIATTGARLAVVVLLWRLAGATAAAPPRVVLAWAAGPFEVRVAFDRPVGADVAREAVGKSINFDASRPTTRAKGQPKKDREGDRGSLRVAAARLEGGGRTLVLTTDPHPRAATYTIDLPVGGGRIR